MSCKYHDISAVHRFSFLQVSDLEESAGPLNNEHLHPPENRVMEQNGEVAAADVIQLQKDNRELEQQIVEKNKVNWNRRNSC